VESLDRWIKQLVFSLLYGNEAYDSRAAYTCGFPMHEFARRFPKLNFTIHCKLNEGWEESKCSYSNGQQVSEQLATKVLIWKEENKVDALKEEIEEIKRHMKSYDQIHVKEGMDQKSIVLIFDQWPKRTFFFDGRPQFGQYKRVGSECIPQIMQALKELFQGSSQVTFENNDTQVEKGTVSK
jgi:hypothetical protein